MASPRATRSKASASSNDFTTQFEHAEVPDDVIANSRLHSWDASTDAIETNDERLGKRVELHGLDAASVLMRDRMSGQLGGEG